LKAWSQYRNEGTIQGSIRFKAIHKSQHTFTYFLETPMRMQSKEKELLPGTEEPNIRIATPLSRLQVSLIQESLRETGWKHSDFFVGSVSPGGARPQYKMTVFQAKAGLKRSEVVQKLQTIVGKFKEEKHTSRD
jgi:hypothetical protein